MEILRLTFIRIAVAVILSCFSPVSLSVKAQDTLPIVPATVLQLNPADSIHVFSYMIDELHVENSRLLSENAALNEKAALLAGKVDELQINLADLILYNDSLNRQVSGLSRELRQKNELLENQLRLLKEKEQLFNEKEQLYKDAINSSIIDKVKLEGQIATRDSRMDGKEREIALLQLSIDEKSRDIGNRNSEIQKIIFEKSLAEHKADSLRNDLNSAEKNLLVTGEKLKYAELKLKDCENRYSTITNKKKKTKVVQGFAIKNYRTPDFALAPKDAGNPSVYVISNKNTSNIEFDYVTGASIMLMDLSKPNGTLTYDVGFFLGFGGNNLFKNFYIGPNFKLFDLLHINIGANVAEYEALKEGFNVGDVLQPGIAIPTTKEWKINGYIGFTFDLELITMIGKR